MLAPPVPMFGRLLPLQPFSLHQRASACSAMVVVPEPAALKASATEVAVLVSKGGSYACALRQSVDVYRGLTCCSLQGVHLHPHKKGCCNVQTQSSWAGLLPQLSL